MYKITITIPVYNAEKFLDKLMSSIIKQTIGFKDIQVILVDDCSTDNGKKIMDKYATKYENVNLIKLPCNNKIAGRARNEGLKYAKGKYLMFADADDFLPKNACELLYNEIESKKADLVTGNYINTDYNGKLWKEPIFSKKKYDDFRLSITDYDKSFFILNSSACNKIFRRNFIIENNIKFLEGLPAEDAYFTTSCFMKSKRAYYIKDVIYCYRQRNLNDNKSVSFHCSREYFENINKSYKIIYENFRENGFIRFYRYVYAKNMSYMLYKFIDSSLLNDNDRVDILKDMSWFYELSVKLKVPVAQKAQLMIIDKILKKEYIEAVNYCRIIADIRQYIPKEVRESMSRPDSDMYKEISKYDNEY